MSTVTMTPEYEGYDKVPHRLRGFRLTASHGNYGSHGYGSVSMTIGLTEAIDLFREMRAPIEEYRKALQGLTQDANDLVTEELDEALPAHS